jgi:predicted hydrocarbon binding protein/KaiC/GvpD/RAD55 family RecA-like ATPase
MTLRDLQQIPSSSLIFLTGPPGAGKTTFAALTILEAFSLGRPTIIIAAEEAPTEWKTRLREIGLGDLSKADLCFVDAFSPTVGLSGEDISDVIPAHCADLNSIMMAISTALTRVESTHRLIVIDSLTSPYLLNGQEVTRFTQLYLAKLAAQGESILVLLDEGVARTEDHNALLSLADGILCIHLEGTEQTLEVVKHPVVSPALHRQSLDMDPSLLESFEVLDPDFIHKFSISLFEGKATIRPTVGDFVHPIWPQLCRTSGMLWDPERFPILHYELAKEDQSETGSEPHLRFVPFKYKLMFRIIRALQDIGVVPKDFSSVRNMKRLSRLGFPYRTGGMLERSGRISYQAEASRESEHVFRVDESSDCYLLPGVSAALATHLPPSMAGQICAMERKRRDWNAIETKCIGRGDSYCEISLSPGRMDDPAALIGKDVDTLERINDQLLQLMAGLITGEAEEPTRPGLGGLVHLHVSFHAFGFPHIAGRRAQTAVRMGGANAGRTIANHLMEFGFAPSEALQRFAAYLERIKVGTVLANETRISIEENVEPLRTFYMTEIREPSCFFTTGFLNGFYNVLFNKHVIEKRCLAAGDRYCEWEAQ